MKMILNFKKDERNQNYQSKFTKHEVIYYLFNYIERTNRYLDGFAVQKPVKMNICFVKTKN